MARGGATPAVTTLLVLAAILLAATTPEATAAETPPPPTPAQRRPTTGDGCPEITACLVAAGEVEVPFPFNMDVTMWSCCQLLRDTTDERCRCSTLDKIAGARLSASLRDGALSPAGVACQWIMEEKILDRCKTQLISLPLPMPLPVRA
ncbi:hypothetical protein ACP4OV_030147 [Aristida adscensionis]